MILFLSLLGLLGLALSYQALATAYDNRRYPAPGRLIDIGGYRLHLREAGTGSPAVVLESGLAASSLSWSFVQPEVAKFTTALSYDRAGFAWSAPSSTPCTAHSMAADLKTLLERAGHAGPFILVGHSFGGLLVRAYAALYPEDVAALVFVDPVSLEHWAGCSPRDRQRLATGTKLSRRGAALATLGVVRFALALASAGRRTLPKLIGRTAAGPGAAFMERLLGEIRKLPLEALPVIRSHWSRPESFRAMASTLASLPENAQAVLQMPIPPHIPFIILSAASATEEELKERDSWVEGCPWGKHIRLNRCGHWLQLEQPGAIVDAIREIMKERL
ncbi:MAG TPA: alpha/beta hydrolase [Bryobacteraceae bacterium]|nr:alpha/beta hydrolase [Bryobacteraceae bacterium]